MERRKFTREFKLEAVRLIKDRAFQPMAISIEFQSCRIATIKGSEEACLVLADGIVMALLVRLDGGATIKSGWYLQIGFGPCNQEGVVFETSVAAAAWIEQRLAASRGNETAA